MPKIDPNIAYHKMAIDPSVKLVPKKKKNRHHGQKHLTTIKVKIDKLLKVGFIKEALHTAWLANVVMVKKTNVS